MKMRNNFPILIFFCLLITTSSCDNDTQTAGSAKETASQNDKKDEISTPAAGNIELQAPDFADPASNILRGICFYSIEISRQVFSFVVLCN